MKALLFGSIGVIVDSSRLQFEAYNGAFDEEGLDWHWDEKTYRAMLIIAGGRARIRHYAEAQGVPVPTDEMIIRVHQRKTALFEQMLADGKGVARPGVARLMDAAHERGTKLGFVTTTERSNVEMTVKAAGIEISDFDVFTYRGTVEKAKPDPACYRLALEKLGVEPGEAVAIEDTEVCLPSALDAGLAVVATPNAFADGQDFSRATVVVDHLGDERRAARTLAGHDIVRAGAVTLDTLGELLERVDGRPEPALAS